MAENYLEQFINAASKGRLKDVKELLGLGAPLDGLDHEESTALMWAAHKGHADVVAFLIESGADVNWQNRPGETALIVAVKEGHTDVVKALIESKKLNPNMKDKEGNCALLWAAMKGRTNIVKLLIEEGADVSIRDREGKTALDYAKNKKIANLISNATAIREKHVKAQEAAAAAESIASVKKKRENPDDLLSITTYGNAQGLRVFLNEAFWRKEEIKIEWEVLKTALVRNDREMMRLLIIWGAKASARELEELKAEKPDDYEGHLKVLRQCGLAPMTEKQKKDEEVATLLSEAKAKVNATLHVGAAAIATTIQAGAVAGVSMPLDRQMASIDTGLKKSSLKSIFNSHIQQKHSEAFDMKPGQLMPDGSIYLGKYTPKDRDGNSLSQIFNVFAAAKDLEGTATYRDTVKKVAKIRNLHGHSGAKYANDTKLYKALKKGTYNGEWIIPTRDVLHGKDVDGNVTFADNILEHKDTGAFNGTYIMSSSSGSDYPDWYWACTEDRGGPGCVWNVRLSDGDGGWFRKFNDRLSCRPVRFVKACP